MLRVGEVEVDGSKVVGQVGTLLGVVGRLVGEGRNWPQAEPGLCWRSRRIGRGGKKKAAGRAGLD